MENELKADKYSFWELIQKYSIEIPIIQRDYAQGREEHSSISNNFLTAIYEALTNNEELNLDFIYGNVNTNSRFQPLDGQQRLTTLFLLHWYAFKKECINDNNYKKILTNFIYEIRISSREFCNSLINENYRLDFSKNVSSQIVDSNWFFLSWKQDSTIRAMLRMIDDINEKFANVDNLWELLTKNKKITFYHLILKDFGLSDDLYIKMNARGRLLSPFENLKAEIQEKSLKNSWEHGINENERFPVKIDTIWTDFLWKDYQFEHNIDISHMRFITTIIMINIALGNVQLKPSERNELIQRLEVDNFYRELIKYIDKEVFNSIKDYYDVFSKLNISDYSSNLEMWRHQPRKNLLFEIMVAGSNPAVDSSSYTQKVLFYAVYLYAINNKETFNKELFLDWIRVVRNIVSRGDVDQNGKRPDIVRSPETFIGVIRLIQELSNGCSNIYEYLKCNNIKSTFARAQIQEEKIKSEIINKYPQHKNLIFKIEDNELLRGQISFILKTSGFDGKNIDTIDYELLDKLSSVLSVYFASENDLNDNLRRAMLTIEVNGKYEFYKYWWSYWVVGNATKRKLFIQFREIEYFMNCEMNEYFSNLLLKLTKNNLIEIINNFIPPKNMENWQIRLIKEPDLLEKHCKSKYIAIPDDNSFCYLLKSQRPRDLDGGIKIE